MSTLSQQISELQKDLFTQIPADILEQLQAKTAELVQTGIADQSIQLGDSFPGFSLSNAVGNTIESNSLVAKGPLIVVFYRGEWCPYCNLELAAYRDHLDKIQAKGANVVAISPQLPDNALTMQQKHDLPFEVLSDQGNALAKQLGLVFSLDESIRPIYQEFGFDLPSTNGDDSWNLPIPATFVIDQAGKVIFRHVDADYSTRAEPEDVISAL